MNHGRRSVTSGSAKGARVSWTALLLSAGLCGAVAAAAGGSGMGSSMGETVVATRTGGPIYRPAVKDSVMAVMKRERRARQALSDSLRDQADQRYAELAEKQRSERLDLCVDWSGIDRPSGLEVFNAAFHFPPQAQYDTGTCWCFCGTSFFEAEVCRLTGRRVKLSEMWTVYWEFVEQARRFVREYGHSQITSGSEDQAVRDIYRRYGAVPAEAYAGVPDPQGRHDHSRLSDELEAYLLWVEEHDYWDEGLVLAHVRALLDREMGRPPETFVYEGRSWTPQGFLAEVLQLQPDDYVSVISTLKQPFGRRVLFDVPDNWRRQEDFLNLRLDDFYGLMVAAAQAGYTASIGGDTSEPGIDGLEDAAIVPSWDIPAEFIDQASREMRIDNGATTDDHGVHLVGYARHGGRDWFLVKDSNRSSRWGRFKGYYFYSGDYVRLKMLSCMVHRDLLAGRQIEG
ncbi:MAG: peptidase C1 [Candidatus Eisenbacteria bacterium]